ADTIVFSSLFNTPQTITLSGSSLVLTDPATATITGPGAKLLSITGRGKSRVFYIDEGSAALSGLTITGGSADSGGGPHDKGGTVALTDCTVSDNSATSNGGGLFNGGRINDGGTLALTDCSISGNFSSENGGGLYTFTSSRTTVSGCTFSGNTTTLG